MRMMRPVEYASGCRSLLPTDESRTNMTKIVQRFPTPLEQRCPGPPVALRQHQLFDVAPRIIPISCPVAPGTVTHHVTRRTDTEVGAASVARLVTDTTATTVTLPFRRSQLWPFIRNDEANVASAQRLQGRLAKGVVFVKRVLVPPTGRSHLCFGSTAAETNTILSLAGPPSQRL